jgi:hypothetical protein
MSKNPALEALQRQQVQGDGQALPPALGLVGLLAHVDVLDVVRPVIQRQPGVGLQLERQQAAIEAVQQDAVVVMGGQGLRHALPVGRADGACGDV